jgi:hypothetical protein
MPHCRPLGFATPSSVHCEGEGTENSVCFHIINSFTSSLPGKRLIVSRRTSHGCEDRALCPWRIASVARFRSRKKLFQDQRCCSHSRGILTELAADACIWTGGFVAPTLAGEAGIAVNERNQVIVDPFMRSLSHPEIYAIGDAASPREDPGVRVRMAAVTAIILAAHGADCLSRVLRGKVPMPLSFVYAGQGIALGPHDFIGFSLDPNDKPVPPYFTGRLGSFIRKLGLRCFAASASIDYRFHVVFWLGKRRYAAQQRRARRASQQVGHLP